jgi:cell division protein FtsI/penicillin-binding protein 2
MLKYYIHWKNFNKRTKFTDLKSKTSKKTTAKHTHEALSYLSGCYTDDDETKSLNIGLLLNFYISKFNITINCDHSEKLKKLLTNINDWIEAAPLKHKDKFKSLLTGIFSHSELREFGIRIGKDKFNQLKSFKENLAVNLRDEKVIQRKKISSDLMKKYLNFLKNDIQAQVNQDTAKKVNKKLDFYLKSNEFSNFNFDQDQIHTYYGTKYQRYTEFISNHPTQDSEKQLSKDLFYTYWPKNYIRGGKFTDLCRICHLIDPSYLKKYPNATKENEILVSKHRSLVTATKEYFQGSLDKLGNEKENVVILFDFKEKFKVGSSKKQIGANFYAQKSVTLLTFCVFYSSSIKVNFIKF